MESYTPPPPTDARGYITRVRESVPGTLLELPVWMLWKSMRRERKGKASKIPFCADGSPRKGDLDTPADRARLVTFDEAAEVYLANHGYAGLGVALGDVPSEEIHLSGIDLDDVEFDDPRVLEIMAAADSYAEVSPSGSGLKIFGTGAIGKADVHTDRGGLEIYSGERFFTVTGQRVNGAHLADLTDAASVARRLWRAEKPQEQRSTSGEGIAEGGRHNAMMSVAGAMRRKGASVEAIEAALRADNARRCNPPLPDDEIRSIATSAGGYAPETGTSSANDETSRGDDDLELVAFDMDALLGEIEPERELLPGIPAEAYTLLAGGLSTAKTTLLHSLLLARATGYDFLELAENGIETGPDVLVSYEDADKRIFRRFQILVQYQHRIIGEMHGPRSAREYLSSVERNIRRVTLTGKAGSGIVCRDGAGNIVPNRALIDELIGKVRKFASADVLIGLDPLRLAIVGSQSDDDGADVVVHVLNDIAGRLPNSGLIVPSHTTKAGAIEPGTSRAVAAYGTSGSALYSQHARSNFLMSRMKADDVRGKFGGDVVTNEEADQERVVQLTHARLSHGAESKERFYVMRNAVLVPVRPNAQGVPLAEAARRALPAMDEAITETTKLGLRASRKALEGVVAIARTRRERRDLIEEAIGQGWLQEAGATTDKRIELTAPGRAQLSPNKSGESNAARG